MNLLSHPAHCDQEIKFDDKAKNEESRIDTRFLCIFRKAPESSNNVETVINCAILSQFSTWNYSPVQSHALVGSIEIFMR